MDMFTTKRCQGVQSTTDQRDVRQSGSIDSSYWLLASSMVADTATRYAFDVVSTS